MILSKPNHIKIYGHRGARGNLPENTLESFNFLFENKINAFETDILISKDLIPVITHDFRLDINMTKDVHSEFKIQCMRRDLSMQEVIEAFASRVAAESNDMMRLLEQIKKDKQIKDVKRYTKSDADSLFAILESNNPFGDEDET